VLNRRRFVGWGENVRRTVKEEVNKSAIISEHIFVVHGQGLRDGCRLPEGQPFFFSKKQLACCQWVLRALTQGVKWSGP
jgi:hypothetical protein